MTQLEFDLDEVTTVLTGLAESGQPGDSPACSRVHVDGIHGIVVLTEEGKTGPVFTDLGSVLNLWSWQGADLRPDQARDLGEALIAWADRRGSVS